MHEVLKRYFNNLRIFRNSNIKSGERFIHYMQRCVLMLVNAIAACERTNKEKVGFQNIAINPVFDLEAIKSADRGYSNNIKPSIENPKSFAFLIWHHPVVEYIMKLTSDSQESICNLELKLTSEISTKSKSTKGKPNYAIKVKHAAANKNYDEVKKILQEWTAEEPRKMRLSLERGEKFRRDWFITLKKFINLLNVGQQKTISDIIKF
jgi:hypothetical protein